LALLGRASPARTLAAAVPVSEARALEALVALSAFDLVRQTDRGWGVAHDMVAEVVRAETKAADRARLQAQLATALEAESGDPAECARLWAAAGDGERAAQAYAAAAQVALGSFADAEAERLADAGLACVGNEVGGAGPRLQLLEARAHARQRRGSLSGARADRQAALEGYRSGPARSRVLADLAMLALGADDPRRASELAELALVEAGADRAATARALEVASVADMNLARPERAEARASEALARYTELGDSRGAARILDARAMATFIDADIRTGTELLDRAAHLFEDSGDLMRTVTPRSTRGHGLVLLAQPAAGLADARQALEIARTLGHPEGQAYALWHCAEALAVLGEADEAIAAGEEARALAMRIDHRGWTATAWRAIGLGQQVAGELEAALAAFEHSLVQADHLDLFACWAAARAALVQVALGRCDDAAPLVDRALPLGPALGRHEARWAAAELAVACGDDSARRLVQVAIDAAERGGALIYLPRLLDLRDAAGGTAG
jgi:tetratricopeptide (TPR) repeat protein